MQNWMESAKTSAGISNSIMVDYVVEQFIVYGVQNLSQLLVDHVQVGH